MRFELKKEIAEWLMNSKEFIKIVRALIFSFLQLNLLPSIDVQPIPEVTEMIPVPVLWV